MDQQTVRPSTDRPLSPSLARTAGRSSARRAFSLLEVIIAVTIVALLAAVVAPRLLRFVGGAKRDIAKTETAALAQQVKLYLTENGLSSPPSDFDLNALLEGDDPYLESPDDLIDPWNNPYVIIIPGEVRIDFDVVSYGEDGQPGGEGDSADIYHGQKD